MNKLLILGSSGFIGGHILQYSKKFHNAGYSIAQWDHKIDGSLLDSSTTERIFSLIQPTHILHLAWGGLGIGVEFNSDTHVDWADFSINLTQNANDLQVELWNIGTGLEADLVSAMSTTYGAAKLAIRDATLKESSNNSRWISIPYVFSIAHKRPRLVNDYLAANSKSVLRNPEQVTDFVEVRDCARQIVDFITESNDQRLVHVTSGNPITNSQFIQKLSSAVTDPILNSCTCDKTISQVAEKGKTLTDYFLSL